MGAGELSRRLAEAGPEFRVVVEAERADDDEDQVVVDVRVVHAAGLVVIETEVE
jgi:hypothetical protein